MLEGAFVDRGKGLLGQPIAVFGWLGVASTLCNFLVQGACLLAWGGQANPLLSLHIGTLLLPVSLLWTNASKHVVGSVQIGSDCAAVVGRLWPQCSAAGFLIFPERPETQCFCQPLFAPCGPCHQSRRDAAEDLELALLCHHVCLPSCCCSFHLHNSFGMCVSRKACSSWCALHQQLPHIVEAL